MTFCNMKFLPSLFNDLEKSFHQEFLHSVGVPCVDAQGVHDLPVLIHQMDFGVGSSLVFNFQVGEFVYPVTLHKSFDLWISS